MKKTLVVIDMQNDFIDGSLGTEEATKIVENVRNKINKYYSQGNRIIFTRDTHDENYLSSSEGKMLPVTHCVKGTSGWNIRAGLEVPDCEYIDKPTFGFINWEFTDSEIEIIGLCTDICVVSNAIIIKTLYPDAHIVVDASCCAGVTPETHKAALQTMKMCQIEIIGE